jgi:CRP-like cAMP-binding protein
MTHIREILGAHPTFAVLDEAGLELLAGCARNRAYKEDEMIFREGDPADTFQLIRRGSVSLEIHAPGRGTLTILTLGEGAILGWSWLFPPHRWLFDARALDPVGVIEMDGRCVREKCEGDHSLGFILMKQFAHVMVDRLQATRLQLLDLYANPESAPR